MQTVLIATKVACSIPTYKEGYSMSLSDDVNLRQVAGSPVSSTNKTERHNITEILLKVALNIIKQTNKQQTNLFQIICISEMEQI
jgi:hypothetical protein